MNFLTYYRLAFLVHWSRLGCSVTSCGAFRSVKLLRECGKRLEQQLAGELRNAGRFLGHEEPIWYFIGARGASLIIYPAVISAWIHVAALGIAQNSASRLMLIPIGAFVLFLLLGYTIHSMQRKNLNKLTDRPLPQSEQGPKESKWLAD